MVPEDVLLIPELLLWMSVTLVKLQKQERLTILPQGLLILLLQHLVRFVWHSLIQ